MGLFGGSGRNDGGGSNDWSLFDLIAAIPVLLIWWPYQMARRFVYKGWEGGVAQFLGLAVGFYFGAIEIGHWASFVKQWPWYMWLPTAGAAWWYIFAAIWPIAYFAFLHPLWRLSSAIFVRVSEFTKKHWETVSRDIVRLMSAPTWAPLWQKLVDQKKFGWFGDLLGIVAYGSLLLASGYLAWHTFGAVEPAVASWITVLGLGSVVGKIAGACAGLFVLTMLAGLGIQFIKYGKLPGLALAYAGVAVAAYVRYGETIGATHGFNIFGYIVGSIGVFWFVTAVVFPALVLAFGNGFWKKLWDNYLEPLGEQAYWKDWNEDQDYVRFFHHAVNLGAAYLVFLGTATVCGALPISIQLQYAIIALGAWCAYGLLFKAMDWEGGNFLIGAAVTLWVGYKAGMAIADADIFYGVYGGFIAFVVTTLASGFVLFPSFYWLVRLLGKAVGMTYVGKALEVPYKITDKAFDAGQKGIKKLCEKAYKHDDSKEHTNFLQLLNVLLVGGELWTIGHYNVFAGWYTIYAIPALVAIPLLSYLLIGKLMLRTGYGVPFVSAVIGGTFATMAAIHVYGMGEVVQVKIAAVASGLFVWAAIGFILFPIAFIVSRFLGRIPGIGLLASLHNRIWGLFEVTFQGIWKAFLWIASPLTKFVVWMTGKLMSAYDRIISIISGRK